MALQCAPFRVIINLTTGGSVKILIRDLAKKIEVNKSTVFKAIKKMGGIQIYKVKVKGVASLMSAIDEKDIEAVRENFGLNTKLIK